MEVAFHPDAFAEWEALPTREYAAMARAFEKLRELGDQLGFPHTSNVEGAASLRELRPRQGRSPWRALYRRIGDRVVVGAVGPEALHDRRGFRRAVDAAEARLAGMERERTDGDQAD